MANQTPNIKLILPANGEFTNSWDVPVNANWVTIDTLLGGALTALQDSAGTQTDLATRLAVAINDDGTLKDIPEVATARNSSIYGYEIGGTDFALNDRIEQGDRETFAAREQAATLLDALAAKVSGWKNDCVNSAPSGFLSFTGANLKVDGSVTPVVSDINGYKSVIRTLMQSTITGAAGTYYVYLQRNATGVDYLDSTGPSQTNGVVSVDLTSGNLIQFTDTTQNFVTSGVKPGDILTITTTGSANANRYVVASVTGATTLLVNSLFSVAQASLNYFITDPLRPTIATTLVAPSNRFAIQSGLIYIGQAVFDGTQITSVFSYALKGRYEQFVSITLTGGNFMQTIVHQLGYVPTTLKLFASQASDYSQPLEVLATDNMTSSTLQRSVIASMSATQILVKNPTNGVYYTDFGGTPQTSGFLLVIAER